jgi:hypothetical protein
MEFDKLVNFLLEKNLGTRVTSGPFEVQDILKTDKIKSPTHGNVFFSSSPEPDPDYLPHYMRDNAPKGSNIGYVLRADADKMENPALYDFKRYFKRMPEKGNPMDDEWMSKWGEGYDKQKYRVLPADSPASDIKTIQRIQKDPVTGDFKFGKERDFARFQKIYNALYKAKENGEIKILSKGGEIEVKPANVSPKLNIKPINLLSRIGLGGIGSMASLNSFLNNELPADMKNNLASQQGGLGVMGKFVAHP